MLYLYRLCPTLYSSKKMISNYKEQKAIDALKNYDIVYNIEESPEAGVFMEKSLLPSDLPRPKDIRAEWRFEYSSGQKAMLYLKKIYSSKEGKSNEALIYKNKLAEKYGKRRFRDSCNMVFGEDNSLIVSQRLIWRNCDERM